MPEGNIILEGLPRDIVEHWISVFEERLIERKREAKQLEGWIKAAKEDLDARE